MRKTWHVVFYPFFQIKHGKKACIMLGYTKIPEKKNQRRNDDYDCNSSVETERTSKSSTLELSASNTHTQKTAGPGRLFSDQT